MPSRSRDAKASQSPENETTAPGSLSPLFRSFCWLLLHLICLAVYLIPVLLPSEHNNGNPVLDELHIVSPENRDVNGESTLQTIFSNDYWGRPMSKKDSHKSWRPLTVLSFRYLKGGSLIGSDLVAHRIVNIVTHACIAEMVAILAVKLIPRQQKGHHLYWLRAMTKLAFALHPTHVEVTANAANRGHLLGVLFSLLLADPDVPFPVFLLSLVAGFLSSETFLFQVVPAAVTLTAILYIRHYHGPRRRNLGLTSQIWTMLSLALPRVFWLFAGAFVYYGGRLYFDTLSIPEGLIRPAENPFFEFKGWHRVRNYAYVLAIHVAKAWDLDLIGFSHEYGRECIRPLESWEDERLYIPQGIAMGYVVVLSTILSQQKSKHLLSIGLLWFLVHLSWMATLFPVSGAVKVGTFISDRIVVAASVSTSTVVAYLAYSWVSRDSVKIPSESSASMLSLSRPCKLFCLSLVLTLQFRRVHERSLDWMDSLPLLESSLKTCPRFAKAHVEISKIYSGLYPERFDLARSRYHLEQAESIDPEFCDVHQQFAHVSVQEQKYIEFEERLTQSLMCPFTLGGSTGLWQQYWGMVLDPQQNPPEAVKEAKKRQASYLARINAAIEKENQKEPDQDQKSSSPLTWNRAKHT